MSRRIGAGACRLADLTGVAAERWQARVLSAAEPDRVVVEYSTDSHAVEPGAAFVAKFFADDRGLQAFEAMRAIGHALERQGAGLALRVPEAVDYSPDDRVLIMRRAPGVPYDPQAPADDRYLLAGQALATLHGLTLDPWTPKSLGDHVAELIRPHPRELAESYPDHRRLIERTLERIAREEAGWPDVPCAAIHRDYQLRQLLLDTDRVWVVDWDLFAWGDPAFDVAYFLVYLETHLRREQLQAAQAAFTRGYLRNGSSGVLARTTTYRRFNLLRRACRRYRLRDAGWESELSAMLDKLAEESERP